MCGIEPSLLIRTPDQEIRTPDQEIQTPIGKPGLLIGKSELPIGKPELPTRQCQFPYALAKVVRQSQFPSDFFKSDPTACGAVVPVFLCYCIPAYTARFALMSARSLSISSSLSREASRSWRLSLAISAMA